MISRVAMMEKTVMKRSSVEVFRATRSSPVVMKTETTTRMPSLVLMETGTVARRRSGRGPGRPS
nr:hypothetical protein [Streptomyces tsukubensis NRRL18488]